MELKAILKQLTINEILYIESKDIMDIEYPRVITAVNALRALSYLINAKGRYKPEIIAAQVKTKPKPKKKTKKKVKKTTKKRSAGGKFTKKTTKK